MTHRLLTWMIVANGASLAVNALTIAYTFWRFLVWRRKCQRILADLRVLQAQMREAAWHLTAGVDQ